MAKKKRNAGITLLEVMVVLGIMAMVIGIAAPRVIDYFGRAKSITTGIQMENIKSALQLFYIDNGRYPLESEGLDLLMQSNGNLPGWNGPYIDQADGLMDPWNRRYIYTFPGVDSAFDLLSLGEDGQVGGEGKNADIRL